MRVEGHLDHRLTALEELLRQRRPVALVGVTVRVVEHHHSAAQQTGAAVCRQPFHRLRRGAGTVRPGGGHHDQRVEIAQRLLGHGRIHRGAAVDDRDREMTVEP